MITKVITTTGMTTKECDVKEVAEVTGIISSVARLVQPGRFGIVKLDELVDGFEFAVINSETKGRVELMTSLGGSLVAGSAVLIKEMRCGPGAFLILEIETI